MQIFHLFCTKNLFFLFYTSNFTKHPHQSIYSTHLFNKIFILLPFFIIFFITSLSLSDLTTIIITTLIDKPFKVKPTQDQKPIQAETHFITHPIRNPLIKKREISELIGSDLIRLRAAVVWCWSVVVVWCWSNEKKEEWGESDQWWFDHASYGCGLMLIGGNGLMLIRWVLHVTVVWCWLNKKNGEWGESESNRDKEREKITKIINASTTITVHICMVTVAIVHFMHTFTSTDMSIFFVKMYKI